ncbi:MAG: reverse transcriptase domain-containing protein [Gemmataceae bacterium]
MCLIRELSNAIRKGTYRPDRERLHRVPKARGGFRILSIPTVRDRVVQRAIVEILTPLVEPTMASTTFGGRPGCSTWDALLAAEADVAAGNNVLVVADIRGAFDVLPHAPLRRSLEARWGATPLVDLIMRIVVNGRSQGIGQGGPLSTLLLNIYLTDKLDLPWARSHPSERLIRWIDDQLAAAKDLTDGSLALREMGTLLDAAGMPPKPETETEPAVIDLSSGKNAIWLGYRICRGPRSLEARIDETAWEELRRELEQAHAYDRPWVHARDLIRGWIAHFGPCRDRNANANRVANLTRELDLEEAIGIDQILEGWQQANRRYCAKRRATTRKRRRTRKALPSQL